MAGSSRLHALFTRAHGDGHLLASHRLLSNRGNRGIIPSSPPVLQGTEQSNIPRYPLWQLPRCATHAARRQDADPGNRFTYLRPTLLAVALAYIHT